MEHIKKYKEYRSHTFIYESRIALTGEDKDMPFSAIIKENQFKDGRVDEMAEKLSSIKESIHSMLHSRKSAKRSHPQVSPDLIISNWVITTIKILKYLFNITLC